jgi:hypothetical protein
MIKSWKGRKTMAMMMKMSKEKRKKKSTRSNLGINQ